MLPVLVTLLRREARSAETDGSCGATDGSQGRGKKAIRIRRLRGYVSDVRTNGLSIVHLEDLAEDKSKRKSAKRPPAAMPAPFSLGQLAQLPPSERMRTSKRS